MACNSTLIGKLDSKLNDPDSVVWYDHSTKDEPYYHSSNPGLRVDVKGLSFGGADDDTVCIDLCTGKFYGGVHDFGSLPFSVQDIFSWYQSSVNDKGVANMSKKEINEVISSDIQKLANDLTKKREMDKADSSAKDIAKKLGVKLPKSKK